MKALRKTKTQPIEELNTHDSIENKKLEQELYMLKNAMDKTTYGAIVIDDMKGKVIYANRPALDMYGVKDLNEAIGKTNERFWKFSKEEHGNLRKELVAKGSINIDLVAKRTDGTLFNVNVRGCIIKDSEGKPAYIMSNVTDLTNTKKSEEALLLKNYVFDTAISANSISDKNGIINECNIAFLHMWGYQNKEEVIGKPIPSFFKDKKEALTTINALNKSGRWEGYFTARRKDGSIFFAQGLATTLQDSHGKLIGYQSAVMDVTENKKAEELLIQSEEKFRMLTEKTNVSVYVIQDGKFAYVNPATEKIFGYLSSEIIGKLKATDLIHPDDRQVITKRLKERLEGKTEKGGITYKGIKKDGSTIYIEIYGALSSYKGRPAIMGIAIDRTSLNKSLLKQRESEKRYKELFNNNPLNHEVYSPDGTMIETNKAFLKFYQIPKEFVVGKYNVLKSEEVKRHGLSKYLKKAFSGKKVILPEIRYDPRNDPETHGKGRARWQKVILYPQKDANGKLLNVSALHIDITDRKEFEDKLIKNEEKYRNLYENALVAIFRVKAKDGKVIHGNRASAKLFGYSSKKEFLREFHSEKHYVNIEDRKAIFKELMEKGSILNIEMHSKKKDGTIIWNQANFKMDSQKKYVDCVAFEITELKKIQEKLVKANSEKDEIAISERSRLERELHDTVTQNIFTASLLAEVIPDIWEKDIEKGKEQLSKIKKITKEALSEIRMVLFQLHDAKFSKETLPEVIEELVEIFKSRSEIHITIKIGKCQLFKMNIKKTLYRIVQESLNNAAKYSKAKNIYIKLKCLKEKFFLSIEDDGIGFDINNIAPDRLGISIIRERAHTIGASCDIISVKGKGTKISITKKNKLKEWLL